MTHDEINEKIAIKKGWHVKYYKDAKRTYLIEDINDGFVCWDNGRHTLHQMFVGLHHDQSPQYTTDWRLAGELFCELNEKGIFYLYKINSNWQVMSENADGGQDIVDADTPQMAIALAWLEWSER